MKSSTIIVTFNCEKTIKDCLKSVFSTTQETEVLVVDNKSNDQTTDLIKQFSKVKLIQNKENFGFGKANNIGANSSVGKYLFFLNPDCIVEKDTIEKIVDFLDKNKNIAVVGPKLINQDDSLQREMSPFPTVLSEILVLLRFHRLAFFKKIVYPNYDYSKIQDAEHLMGSALVVRREIFEQLGGFDSNFFLWFEETDLLKRIKDTGYKIVYFPDTTVTHLVGQSTKQINFLKKQTIWNKSLILYFKKHKQWYKLLVLLPFIVLSYLSSFLSYLIKR